MRIQRFILALSIEGMTAMLSLQRSEDDITSTLSLNPLGVRYILEPTVILNTYEALETRKY